MGQVYLGVDIGTTSAKCLAVDDNGQALAFAQHPYSLTHPHQGWAEQAPEDYWHGLVEVVRQCVTTLGPDFQAGPLAIALSTQGDTLIITDPDGHPLLPAISWMDARGEAEFRELLADAGASFWYRETGSPLNVLSSACKIRWLAKNRPDILAAKPRFCWVSDYLAKRLCGRFVTDAPSASWTPLFTPSRRDWSQPVLDLLGIERDTLPEVIESGEVIGTLSTEAARELGLSPETNLIAGAFDQAAAAHGAGARAGGASVLSCGTAWVLYSVAADAITDPKEQLCTCCHTGRSETGLVLPFPGGSTYEWLTGTIGEVGEDELPSGADPLIFVPHLYGGLSPDWRGESRGSLVGLTLGHNRADIRRALLRGLAYEARRNLEAAERLCGRVESVIAVGGAMKGSSNSAGILANVLKRAITVPNETESACFGAAKLASRGLLTGSTGPQTASRFEPIADEVAIEDELYARYRSVLEAMTPLYGTKE